jgi:phosphoglycerate dehydrogenase-like enzyme
MPDSTRQIVSVLSTVRYPTHHLASLRDAFAPARFIHLDPSDDAGIRQALREVDVAVLAGDLDDRFFAAPNLRWIHCDHSGLNESARPEIFERGLIVTGSAGRAAPALAQHALFFALALTYDSPGLLNMQRRHVWRGLADFSERRGLWGKTMGIVGLGETGLYLATMAKALGMNVLAYRKSPTPAPSAVDRLYSADSGESADELLSQSDVVVLCIRLTDATRHLIGERELRIMKKSAFLINIARGPVVNESALVAALRSGEIAGAGLDVFETEPLPDDAPVWDAPHTIITPHVTAEMPDLVARSLEIITANIRHYRSGGHMLNVLKPDDLYTFTSGNAK